MKVESIKEASEVAEILDRIISNANKQYQVLASNGANVHEFNNKVNTARAHMKMLKFGINMRKNLDDIQRYTDLAVHHSYHLAKWVGEQIAYYTQDDEGGKGFDFERASRTDQAGDEHSNRSRSTPAASPFKKPGTGFIDC